MKKVLLISVLALACMAGCKEDDESVALTGITVNPPSVEKVVGESQQVTATAVPANATDVNFVWTSQNTDVATVDGGLITITGEGTTTVIVRSGSVPASISVTGLAKNVPLTGIAVEPASISKFLTETQQVTVTPSPADATGVTYAWMSANTSVATVSEGGLVRIEGAGTTTVTVTATAASGIFTATVDVEGNIREEPLTGLELKDVDGNNSGSYPFEETSENLTFTLAATTVPAGVVVTPDWSSNSDNVTVVPSENGMSAQVTISGQGAATVTAAVDDITAEYYIETTSFFDGAAGYWTFQDADNLGKATKGTDLMELTYVDVVAGPSATKKAVQVKDQQKALKWEHNLSIADYEYNRFGTLYKIANTFTVLFDVQPTEDMYNIDRIAAPLYWNEYLLDIEYAPKAENYAFAVRSMDNFLKLYANGNAWSFEEFTPEIKASKPWYRIVIKVWPAVDGEPGYEYNPDGENSDPNGSFHRELWVNGVKIEDQVRNDNTFFRVGFFENMPTWFLTGSETNRTYFDDGKQRYYDNIHIPCSTIAVWNGLLTDEEVTALGGVSK
jgi:hypothetical protein